MNEFNVGDVVARRSYDYDILFKVTRVNSNGIVDLVGLTVRIVADAPEYDLKRIEKDEVEKRLTNIEKSRKVRMNRCFNMLNPKNKNGNFGANPYFTQNNNTYNNTYNSANNINNSMKNSFSDSVREKPYINEDIYTYKKENILKKPGIILHLDGDTHLSYQNKYSNTNISKQGIFNHN